MYWMVLCLVLSCLISPTVTRAEEERSGIPGFNERLNQALGYEGGVQVYMDPEGQVGTLIDPPGGERTFTVQPSPSPSISPGPPLQLHNPPRQLPMPSDPPQRTLPEHSKQAR